MSSLHVDSQLVKEEENAGGDVLNEMRGADL